MKNIFNLLLASFAVMFAASCSNNEELVNEASQDAQAVTRTVGTKTPKFTVYVETNDINPLNAGEYVFNGTTEEAIDHVILFASNIRGTATTVELYHNPNQTHILNNVNTLVRPLQQKGIKVLLGLLGDHTGYGFANLSENQMDSFAQQVANCVNQYGLDGVDFDDEYADYQTIPSAAKYGLLVQKVRALLPNKLVTAFYYGNVYGFDQTTLNAFDYLWPNFGCNSTNPTGFDKGKWAKLSVHCTNTYLPAVAAVKSCAGSYAGYGAVMMFNLRENNCSSRMNEFASLLWNGRSISWTGTSHLKNY